MFHVACFMTYVSGFMFHASRYMFGFHKHHIIWIGWGIAMGLCTFVFFWAAQTSALRVHFFDVGQGDASLIITPGGREVLIDTGASPHTIDKKLAERRPFFDRSIDLVILTHPDKDHVAGAATILRNYAVGGVIMPHVAKDEEFFEDIMRVVQERHIPVLYAEAGNRVRIDEEIYFDILWPPKEGEKVFPASDTNDMSIVARLVYNNDTFLFTGDLEERGERLLGIFGASLNAEVLKVGHHGSSTSTSEDFLARVHPHLAIISAGTKNPYGHPHHEILERLTNTGIETLRTDENGDIILVSDGDTF